MKYEKHRKKKQREIKREISEWTDQAVWESECNQTLSGQAWLSLSTGMGYHEYIWWITANIFILTADIHTIIINNIYSQLLLTSW